MIRFLHMARSAAARLPTRLLVVYACALPAALATGAALAQPPQPSQPVSRAEVLLFETDHLASVRKPLVLTYDFRKLSNVEPGFVDSVELDLTRPGGRIHTHLRFLSGERRRQVPDIDDAHGNPVLLGFLERDIAEMKRLTGGSVSYFRKRIRMALADKARLSRQPISFQGKTFDATVVRIQPYLDDPLHARFEQYVRKTYTFVMSEGVPGGVYRIASSLADEGGRVLRAAVGRQDAPAPAIEETLTLAKVADLPR